MDRLLNPLLVQERLNEKKLSLFTLTEFKRLFDISEVAAKKFTERYVKKGLFLRLKRGLFVFKTKAPSPYLMANRLYEPSYISFDTALSFHGIIPETIYTITSATTKATREFQAAGIRFTFRKIKKEVYTGYRPLKYLGETILVAEPEKALADYLYFIELKKRRLEYDRLDLRKIKKTRLISYAKMLKRPKMLNLIEKIYADFRKLKRIY